MIDPIADPRSRHSQILRAMMGDVQTPAPRHFRRAAELGVFPTFRAWMESAGADVTASDPGAKREQIAFALRERALHQVVDRLDVPFAVLKGIPLGRELYGDAKRRASSDIDLLVESGDVPGTLDRLQELGFEPVTPFDKDANRELELVHRDHGLLVDLHWRIAFPWVPAPDTSALLASRTRVRMDGVEVPVLSRADRFLHLALHFHDHVGFAKGLLDIAAFVDVHGASTIDELVAETAGLGLSGVVAWPFSVMNELGVHPETKVEATRTVQLWAGWSAQGVRGVLDGEEPIGARHPASFKIGEISRGEQVLLKAATMALLDRKRDRIRAMSQPILSSPMALARKRGEEEASWTDWARWAARPASLVAKQLQDLADRDDR